MTPLEAETAYEIALNRLEENNPATQEQDLAAMMQVAEAGYAPAQYAYAYALDLLTGDILSGLPWLLAAARQGHADAHHRLRELYSWREEVRARMGELVGAEELQRFQMKKPNVIVWFFGREEGRNSHFGQCCAMLVGLAIICPLAWYNLLDFVAGWEGSRPWRVLWEGMLIRQAGVFFGLCFLVAFAVDWVKPGSAGVHPLVVGTMLLLLVYVGVALLCWGVHELCHVTPGADDYWWLPGGLACLGGGL